MRGEIVVETRNLSMHFGGVKAVDRVNFNLWENELRCLIGPNGAGKSTFFKCLTGQLDADRGRRGDPRFHRHRAPAPRGRPARRRHQDPGAQPLRRPVGGGKHLAVGAQVARCAARPGADAATLERLRLGDIRHDLVGRLAHGQRQWVELGMVVAAEPWLVLLDEPAAGMTHEETERTAETHPRDQPVATMIVVEHDMQFIRMISSKVTVFHEGRILIEDNMDVVSADPRVRDVYLGHRRQ
jgi:branched-chain amino acid transport system ATP-binding protein